MLLALAQTCDVSVPNDLQTVNIPESIEALRLTLYQHHNAARSPTSAYFSFLDPLRNLYNKLRSTRQGSEKKYLRMSVES